MHLAHAAQSFGGRFGRDVSLGAAEHFKADKKFSYGRRPQQRRIKMRVKMHERIIAAVGRPLMKAHRIGKRRLKNIVVSRRYSVQRIGQIVTLSVVKPVYRDAVLF